MLSSKHSTCVMNRMSFRVRHWADSADCACTSTNNVHVPPALHIQYSIGYSFSLFTGKGHYKISHSDLWRRHSVHVSDTKLHSQKVKHRYMRRKGEKEKGKTKPSRERERGRMHATAQWSEREDREMAGLIDWPMYEPFSDRTPVETRRTMWESLWWSCSHLCFTQHQIKWQNKQAPGDMR